MYMLSNNMLNQDHQIKQVFEIVSSLLSEDFVMKFFAIDIPGIRSAWENLIKLAGEFQLRDHFLMLFNIGSRHPAWVRSARTHYLSFAASMHCVEVFRDLLKDGLEPATEREICCSFIDAVAAGDLECAEMLLKYLNADHGNGKGSPYRSKQFPILGEFLYYIGTHDVYQLRSRTLIRAVSSDFAPIYSSIRFTLDNEIHRDG